MFLIGSSDEKLLFVCCTKFFWILQNIFKLDRCSKSFHRIYSLDFYHRGPYQKHCTFGKRTGGRRLTFVPCIKKIAVRAFQEVLLNLIKLAIQTQNSTKLQTWFVSTRCKLRERMSRSWIIYLTVVYLIWKTYLLFQNFRPGIHKTLKFCIGIDSLCWTN